MRTFFHEGNELIILFAGKKKKKKKGKQPTVLQNVYVLFLDFLGHFSLAPTPTSLPYSIYHWLGFFFLSIQQKYVKTLHLHLPSQATNMFIAFLSLQPYPSRSCCSTYIHIWFVSTLILYPNASKPN